MSEPGDWEGDVVLADGATVHMRAMRLGDVARLAEMYERLSADSVYYRFFSPVPRTTATSLEMNRLGHEGHFARIALLGDEIMAAARYDVVGPGVAEVAFVVADEHQGRGVGTLLLEHLAVIARTHGIHTFAADTLPNNGKMLGLFAAAGWERDCRFESGTVKTQFSIAPTLASTAAIADREHLAEAASMARLFSPRSVAVIGASRDPAKIGNAVLSNLLAEGFEGTVYPVNPHSEQIAGVPAYASLADIPGPVDLAVVVRAADHVLGIVDECARKHVHALVILSAGFAEAGAAGAELQRAVVSKARANGMRVVGPNCLGVANTSPAVRLNATFAPTPPLAGNVAFLSQSGGLGTELLTQAAARGIGISGFISVGNKSDVSGNDLLQYWDDDPRTDVILLHLESFGNPRKFARIARRVSRHKPIVAVKSGRTHAGSRAASTHTAALATSDVAVDALFRQAGVIRVDTLEDLFDTAQLLASQPLPAGPRVAIVSNAGGPGILAADACVGAGLRVEGLSPLTREHLRRAVTTPLAVGNPIDLGVGASGADFAQAIPIVLGDDAVDAVILVYAPPVVTDAPSVACAVAAAVHATASAKPVVTCFLGRPDVAAELRGRDGRRTIPAFAFPESAARALGRAAELTEWRARPVGTLPELEDIDIDAVRALIESRLGESTNAELWLATPDIQAVLRELGVSTLAERRDLDAGYAPPPGLDVIVGITQDPLFGPLLLLGLGGVIGELVGDRSLRILPVTDEDARDLVRSLRTSPLLFGYRDTPALDVAALEDLILRIARLAQDVPEITEMDLNPITVHEHGVVVGDAKVRVAPAPRVMPPELRRMRD